MTNGRYMFLLLSQLSASTYSNWIDPDTPESLYTTAPYSNGDERVYKLVFSDEFEVEGRRFDDGADPRWTALHKNDFTNNPLHYYSRDSVI